jgi:ABC-type branched-subunit amino acid transport system substrate-binding protein
MAIDRITRIFFPNDYFRVPWKTLIMKIPRIAYIAIAGITMFVATKIFTPGTPTSICEAAYNLDRISCGDKILLIPPGGKNRREKEAGFAAIKKKDFRQAIELLQKDWDLSKDPETLIALNNAKIALDRPQNVKTVVTVIPSSQTPEFVSVSILKGVAEAQREFNQKEGGWKLIIALADDSNDPNKGKEVVEELVKHKDVLATLGHYSSNVTVNVKDIYNQAHMLLLSATSAADELTSKGDRNYFFRVVSSTQVSGEHLAKKWATKPDKIALFYTPNKKFSESLRKAFLAHVPPTSVVKEFDLSSRNNAAQEIAFAKAAGAKTIVIIPDAYTDASERDRVLSIIKATQGQLPILGASILRDAYLFKVDPLYLKNLVITIPVHPIDRQFIDEARLNQAPNWWGAKSNTHDRIIDSYDAMQVLLAALDRSTNRETVRQTIAAPGFSARGITGKISFQGSDRAEKIDSLVTPNSCNEGTGCNYQLAN